MTSFSILALTRSMTPTVVFVALFHGLRRELKADTHRSKIARILTRVSPVHYPRSKLD